MSEQTEKVKRADHNILCVTCCRPLPKSQTRKITPSQVKSLQAVMSDCILAALQFGPATCAEIQDRIGVQYKETPMRLRALERRGLVRLIGKGIAPPNSRGRAANPNLWALAEVKA